MCRIEVGATAIGEEELARCAACFADTLRKGERQHARYRHVFTRLLHPKCLAFRSFLSRRICAEHMRRATRACHPGPAGRQLSHLAGATRTVTAETFPPICEIGGVAAKSALH